MPPPPGCKEAIRTSGKRAGLSQEAPSFCKSSILTPQWSRTISSEMGTEKPQTRGALRAGSGLPVSLQALRERAGLGLSDGAGPGLREFFAEDKFSGDPDRPTAIAMVAVDAIVRDPSMLDATTCFGEGQVDTAVGAARLVLGGHNLEELCEIRGEDDLEQLADKCRKLSGNRDIKAGCMAARHLWGMCNTVLRTFPSSLFRNGACDDFQTALLATAGRHLGVFTPDSGDLQSDFREMVARAERIAELGGAGKYHTEPKSEKEAAEAVMHMARMGKFSEIRDSSLVDMVSSDGVPSAKATKLLGLKKAGSKPRRGERKKEGGDWIEETSLSGNGAFFAGRTYEEVKARYPGYPGYSTESSYWDTCSRHPATHGICCRLYSKVPLLTRVGGVEEGLSRAVTNKLVHHNTKFSRLSLWVKLSNGKGFWVHRTRPINWAAQGVSTLPFGTAGGQMELFGESRAGKSGAKNSSEEVTVTGFELKAMNYSHMPWVNKAISQYVEEAPFINSPTDEHQTCLSVLSKALREGGIPYRESVEKAADIYSLLPGRGRVAAAALSRSITQASASGDLAGDCEASLAAELRRGGLLDLAERGSGVEGEGVLGTALGLARESLQKGVSLLERSGISPTRAKETVLLLSGRFPVVGSGEGAREVLGKLVDRVSDRDLEVLSREVTGLATSCTKAACSLSSGEADEIASLVGGVLRAGVFERGKVSDPSKGEQARAVADYSDKAVAVALSRGLSADQAGEVAKEVLGDAVDLAVEIEIRLAQSGATLGDKERETLFAYCAKHSKGNPLSAQDMHNRIASYGGGFTISLDAPVGEDHKDDLYSVFSPVGDHDPEEAAFGGGEIPHWLDAEKVKEGGSSRPSFMPDGGDEIFSSFGVDTMAEDLYRVVSTKGDIEQKDLLEKFAALNIESIASRGGSTAAREQISAMLDLLDREEELPRDDVSTRRKALTWIFQSVLNSVGEDREGFQRLGGAGGGKAREALFDKIRRHGMPGVLVREGEPEPTAEFGEELSRLKHWGYTRIGLILPAEAGESLAQWAVGGGSVALLEGIKSLGEIESKKLREVLIGMGDGAVARAASAVLGGEGGEREEGTKYLNSRPDTEAVIMGALGEADAALCRRLNILRIAKSRGMGVDFLGADGARCADAARLDSVLMVDRSDAVPTARRLVEFGISARVIKGGVDGVVKGHPDYDILPSKDGADRDAHLQQSRILLPKRLVLAAISAHESTVKD